MKLFIKPFIYISLVFLVFLSIAFFLITESTAQVERVAVLDSHLAKQSKYAVKRLVSTLKLSHSARYIYLSQQELTGISALIYRAAPQIRSEFLLQEQKLQATMSIELPYINRYLNIQSIINDSRNGLAIEYWRIGKLVVNGSTGLNLVKKFVNRFVEPKLGDRLVGAIKHVITKPNAVSVFVEFPQELLINSKSGGLFALFSEKFIGLQNRELISNYLDHIVSFASKLPHDAPLELFIHQTFVAVSMQIENNPAIDVIAENEAALLALVLYFGDHKFWLLTGIKPSFDKLSSRIRIKHQSHVTLLERVDLQKHFIYSVGLQLLSNASASDAVGEFKELLDSNRGGSGFSFIDLLADRAGTRFAQNATASDASARKLVRLLMGEIEKNALLPSYENLPEGLTAEKFRQHFADIESESYQEMIEVIDQRLGELPLYQIEK